MALSTSRLLAIARKEVLQLRRDPRSLGMAFVVPALMIVFFGYVISFDVNDIKLAVLDQDRTQRSEELIEAFQSAVQAIVDGADANTAAIALNYADVLVTAYSARIALGTTRRVAPVTAESRVWYNETLKSSNMIVPGLVAMIMMIISAMLTALTVAREWERGTMEQLAATPVHRVEVIFGKLLPYLGIGLIDVTAAVLIGIVVFGVPFRGSPFLLFWMATFFLIGSLSLGIWISATVKSQMLATQTAMLATYLPSMILSGLMFDVGSMPIVLRAISTVVPAKYFIIVLRGIFLKGVGLAVLWAQGLAMVLFAAVALTLAVRAFRKEIA
jgi:ABC-2 type transport system permease protein